MTQEDWSGTGEAETSNADSPSETSIGTEVADDTWGDSAIGEASIDEGAEAARAVAVPATTRSSATGGRGCSRRSSGSIATATATATGTSST